MMDKILRYPKTIIAITLLITVFFGYQLPQIRVNNDLSMFLGENNPAKAAYDTMQDVYESTEAMVIALHNPYGSILTPETLTLIDDLTRHLDTIPLIRSVMSLTNADYITGSPEGLLVEPLLPEGQWDNHVVDTLKSRLFSWPEMYRLMLYSDDMKSTQIMLYMESGLEVEKLESAYEKTQAVLNDRDMGNLEIYLAGAPAISVILKEKMYNDMKQLIPVVVLVILVILFLSFRTSAGVILPLVTVAIASIWTLGLMSLLNIHLTMVGTAIPVILISVGSAYCIHLLSHYYDEIYQLRSSVDTQDEHRTVIRNVLHHVGVPIALTALTTMVGFGSLVSSSIIPLRESGIFLAFGVLTALGITLLFVPSLLILRQHQLKGKDPSLSGKQSSRMDRFLLFFYDFFVRHSVRNLLITLVIIALCFVGMNQILVDTNMIETFRSETPIAQADRFQNETFGGTTLLSVIVDGGEKGALLNPEILQAVDQCADYLEREIPLVGKVTTLTDLIKRMNQIMHIPPNHEELKQTTTSQNLQEDSGFSYEDFEDSNENMIEETGFTFEDIESDKEPHVTPNTEASAHTAKPFDYSSFSAENIMPLLHDIRRDHGTGDLTADRLIDELARRTNYKGAAYYEIPTDPSRYPAARGELQNLIAQYLLLYSGSLGEFADDPLEPSQTRMIVQMKSPRNAHVLDVEEKILDYARNTFPEGYSVQVTGLGKLTCSVNDLVIRSQTSSIITSLLIVFSIISISYHSFLAGLYGIITLSLSLLINFGVMGFFNIKLDMGSSMVASVAIGIGIDYTIHFLSAYRREREKTSNLEIVTKKTLTTAGKAILFNALAVGAGFAVLIYSNFTPLENLGILIVLTMFTSSFGALTVLPALLNTFKPRFILKTGRKS
ncbi:MAG: efflux RND transporter permease subunit [Fidelibacterota bacterium]